MTAEMILFGIFAFFLVLTALGVVFSRSPVYAAMNLVAAFFFMAGVYVLLTAHLIAFMQVLVYAGAVMVLFLFVIMLISLGDEHLFPSRKTAMHAIGVLGALALCSVIAAAIYKASGSFPPMREVTASFGTVKAVGQTLFTDFLLPFEATSLLLLVAIVGAVVVAKERI
jgi:NADH-quinone oxidoreductase subunit J